MDNQQIEIRRLKTKDFFQVAKILSKLGNKVMQQLNEETNSMQAGLLLLTTALENAESDMLEWLADLAGKTPEEFEEMDFDTPLLVIEALAEKEDLNRFFVKVRALIQKYATKQ